MVLCLETSISPHNIHIGKIDHIPIFIDKMYELIIKRISNINLNIVSILYFKILNQIVILIYNLTTNLSTFF